MGDSYSPHKIGGRKRHSEEDDPTGKKRKNREAAQRCREKKQQETNNLKKHNAELMEQNRNLRERKTDLEKRLLDCIREIEQHKLSGCQLPDSVRKVIESVQSMNTDFIPVGIKVTNGETIEDVEAIYETQPTVPGLFTGSQLSTDAVDRRRTRNPSSRSPSRSPPLSVGSPAASQPSGPAANTYIANGNTRLSWNKLHNKNTLVDQWSPGLSPSQTVPNIDTDSLHHSNGFPSIDEAVKMAQKSPGVTQDTNLPHVTDKGLNSYLYTTPEGATRSLGFNPQSTPLESLRSTASNVVDQTPMDTGIQNAQSHYMLSDNSNTMKQTPTTSAVSMNYTAELLSQAINSNFEPSEIAMSEDLKKQFVRLTSTETSDNQTEPITSNSNSNSNSQNFVEHYEEVVSDQSTVNIPLPNTPVGDNQGMSFQGLLDLAKNQTKITVQYQGKDFECTYDELERLVANFRNKNRVMYIDNNNDDTVNNNVDQTTYQTQNLNPVVNMNNANDQNTYYYFENNPEQIFTLADNNDNNFTQTYTTIPVVQTPFENMEVPVQEPEIQTTQLPTTVLSMIEDVQPPNPQSVNSTGSDSNLDSVDYGQNVQDLPSLSLTEVEDHTNIFEKKRKSPLL